MKLAHEFNLRFPLVSTYEGETGLHTLNYGELLLSGTYVISDGKPEVETVNYELGKNTTLNSLMGWLQFNTDAQIQRVVDEYVEMLQLLDK